MWMGQPRRGTGINYHVKKWPPWEEEILGQKNVAHRSLVDKMKIYLPPLHIKPGLIKIYVKAMNKEGKEFSRISEAKIKEGIFVGPLIR